MNYPESYRYTKEHEWVRIEGDRAVVGITDFAQDALGDVVFVALPEVGGEVAAAASIAEVESTKSVSEIYAPIANRLGLNALQGRQTWDGPFGHHEVLHIGAHQRAADLALLEGVRRLVGAVGEDDGDAVAHVPHLLLGQGREVGCHHVGSNSPYTWDGSVQRAELVSTVCRVNARVLQGARHIELGDLRVCNGATQNGHVQCAWDGHVVSPLSLAR